MNGNTYKGSWKKDKKHGYGEYKYYLTGERYEGEWFNGEKKGNGTFEFSFGQKYTGSWLKNEKSGLGKLNFIDGSEFEGNWLQVLSLKSRTKPTAKEACGTRTGTYTMATGSTV